MSLENNLRMSKVYSNVELKNVNKNGSNMLSIHSKISNDLKKNAVFGKDDTVDNLHEELD